MKRRPRGGHEGGEGVSGPDAPDVLVPVEALFRAHARFVAGLLLRLGAVPADVDDLVQETFLVAHRHGGFVPGRASARSWLGAIAVRVLSTHRRGLRRARRREQEAGAATIPMVADNPERRFETRAAVARLARALDELDLEHRTVFVLYELEGEPCARIAEALDIPLGTVHSRLHHARARVLATYRRFESARVDRASGVKHGAP